MEELEEESEEEGEGGTRGCVGRVLSFRNRFRVYKMTDLLPSGILVPISLQRLSLNTRMQAVNGSNPLVASYSRVGLPGPSSSGPASRCSILGRVATVADTLADFLYQ